MRIIPRTLIAAVIVVACTTFLPQRETAKAASEDRPQIGTLNGQPLLGVKQARAINTFVAKYNRMPSSSADNQEIASITAKQNCPIIQWAVRNAARETAKHSLGINASPGEIAQASNAYWALNGDPKIEFTREQTRQLTRYQALTAVLDQHQDPQKVYQNMLAPIGESQIGWETDLKQVQWQWPQIRDSVAKEAAGVATWTLEGYKKTKEAASQKLLEDQNLDDTVDDQLAAQDAHFRADLNEYRKNRKGNVWLKQGATTSPYMDQARQQFWQSRYAEQQVRLNDPTLASQCQLGSMGVKVASN
jgi:hypothetical protein